MSKASEHKDIEKGIELLMLSRWNSVTGMTEFTVDDGLTYELLTDREQKNLLRALRAQGLVLSDNALNDILRSDFSVIFDPYVDYFDSLDEWDGETDFIGQLCDLVKIKNYKYWKTWFKKWFVGTVVNVLEQDKVNGQFLALVGGQGVGKTTFLTGLMPHRLERYISSGYQNPESKDTQIQASECMIVNMDELSSLKFKQIEAFKQLLTQKAVRLRKPYGVNAETYIRRASFCGSTNNDQFLIDITGNRRFLCFTLEGAIDFDGLANFNIDKAYAQAYALYKDGFEHWFNMEENQLIEENNQDYIVMSQVDELIIEKLVPANRESDANYQSFTSTQITILLDLPITNKNTQDVGRSLKKLGYEKFKTNGTTKYALNLKQ